MRFLGLLLGLLSLAVPAPGFAAESSVAAALRLAASRELGPDFDEAVAEGDWKQVLAIARPLAQAEDPQALHLLGTQYWHGDGVQQNRTLGRRYWVRAADAGEPAAILALAESYEAGTAQYVTWRGRAGAAGHVESQFLVGVAHLEGSGTDQRAPEAVRWFQRAADRGHPGAQFYLGYCYQNGLGLERDEVQARAWLEKSAAQGYPMAQGTLGSILISSGEEADRDRALELLERSADAGNAESAMILARFYHKGDPQIRDLDQAIRWATVARDAGDRRARGLLRVLERERERRGN